MTLPSVATPPAGAPLVKSDPVTGGEYRSEQNKDGTWNIYDVEIYASHTRNFGPQIVTDAEGKPKLENRIVKVDRDWLEKSIEKARLRYEKDKHWPRLHIRHHTESKTEPSGAGFFKPKAVVMKKYEDKDTDVLLADFLDVPNDRYQEIKAKKYPYRSVEILDIKAYEINSVALLETSTPYFRFPILTIGEEKAAANLYETKLEPVVAYSSVENKLSALCYFAYDDKKFKREDVDEDEDEDETEEDEEDEEEGVPAEEMQELQQEDQGLGEEHYMKMMQILEAIAAKLGVGSNGSQGGGPVEMAPTAKPANQFDAAKYAEEKADLLGQLNGLKSRVDAKDKDDALRLTVDKALVDLAAYNLGPKAKEEMFALAKDGGEKALLAYVAATKKHGVQAPPTEFNGDINEANQAAYPAEVLAYTANGPEAVAKAVGCWKDYLALGSRVSHIKLADWIKTNVAAETTGSPIAR